MSESREMDGSLTRSEAVKGREETEGQKGQEERF